MLLHSEKEAQFIHTHRGLTSFLFQLSDFHSYVVHGVIKDNLKLERAVVLFNNITQWVQCMILDHHKPQERAQAIVKFIEISKVWKCVLCIVGQPLLVVREVTSYVGFIALLIPLEMFFAMRSILW